MATNSDLFLSILALDSYNRGYSVGLDVTGSTIGNASITSQEFTLEQKAVSFYATAYEWRDETIISYRGTRFDGALGPDFGDVLHGWTLSAGYAAASQPQMAKQFWQSIRDLYPTATITTTGHSLGGGLARHLTP